VVRHRCRKGIARERRVDRYYDPTTDQFLSVDQYVGETGEPYAFTGDDPLNCTDPTGTVTTGVQGGYETQLAIFYQDLIANEPVNRDSQAYEKGSASRYISPFDPISIALSGAEGITSAPKVISSNAGKVLGVGGEAASNAGRILPGTGALRQVFEGAPEALAITGGAIEAFQDVNQGHSVLYASGDVAATLGGGYVGSRIGAGVGTFVCGSETAISDGVGVFGCGAIITIFGAGGGIVGHWLYSNWL
jgi:hypothetical protein